MAKRFIVLLSFFILFDFISASPVAAWYGKKATVRHMANSGGSCCKCPARERNRVAGKKLVPVNRIFGRDANAKDGSLYEFAQERPRELLEVDYHSIRDEPFEFMEDNEHAYMEEYNAREREQFQVVRNDGCSGDWQPCETCQTSEIIETHQPPPQVDIVEYFQPDCCSQPCQTNSCCQQPCPPSPPAPPPFPPPPQCIPLPNPVVNGNFEAPGNSLSDWFSTSPFVSVGSSTAGAPTYESLVTIPPQVEAVYHSAEFAIATNNAPATLSQPSVPVCPGTFYSLNFFLASDATAISSNCSLAINIGSQVLYAQPVVSANPTGGIVNAGAVVVMFPGAPGWSGPFPGAFPQVNPQFTPGVQGQPGQQGGFGQPGFNQGGFAQQPTAGFQGFPEPYSFPPPPGLFGEGLPGFQPLSITATCTGLTFGHIAHVYVDEINLQPVYGTFRTR